MAKQEQGPHVMANPFLGNVFLVGQAQSQDGESRLMLRVEGVNGSFMFGIGDEQAVEVGKMLMEEGERRQHSGLTVARSPLQIK